MSRILCIETSTHVCSVALCNDGDCIDYNEIVSDKYSHAENLHPMIAGLKSIRDYRPDAVAVSKGPGSFTGLRIGVAAAKGLCLAWQIPLISVDTLSIMFDAAFEKDQSADVYVPMIDARRMEVYMRIIKKDSTLFSEVEARVIDESFFAEFSGQKVAIFGDGASKFESITGLGHHIVPGIFPSARFMISRAHNAFISGSWEEVESFEPYYLKDFIPGISKTVGIL